jgi:hypothetical protein
MPRNNAKRYQNKTSSEDEIHDLEDDFRPTNPYSLQTIYQSGTSWIEPKENEVISSSKDSEIPSTPTAYDLLGGILQGKINISPHRLYQLIVIAYGSLVSYIFIVDNSYGRLDDLPGLLWLIEKIKYLSVFVVIIFAIIFLINLINDRTQKKPL